MKITKEKLFRLFPKEQKKFWPQVKRSGVLLKRLQFLVICVILVTVLTLSKFLFVSHAHLDVVQGWECVVQLSEEKLNKLAMKEKYNSLFASVKLNSSCYLSNENLSDCLPRSVLLDSLNLRPVSSQAESTQYLPTQSDDLQRFSCYNDLSSFTPDFDLGILKRNPSLDSNDFFLEICMLNSI